MRLNSCRGLAGAQAALVAGLLLGDAQFAGAQVSLTRISADPYTNPDSYHATEVEPDTFAHGSTLVAAFQVGRFTSAGASNVGWATSVDGGATWTNGFLPGTTRFATPPGPYDRVSDPSVAYDAKHDTWLISSLALDEGLSGAAIIVNRSTDGGFTWSDPVIVAAAGRRQDFDKNWTVCDSFPTSPFYGNCYTEWDDFARRNRPHVSTSDDGGLTWTGGRIHGRGGGVVGGQPLVQPDGTVVMPIANALSGAFFSYTSTDGGANFSGPFRLARIKQHVPSGNVRAPVIPSAEADGAGKVYVVWQDCRFRRKCSTNDLVLSTSMDGVSWTDPVRVPIDPVDSNVDHFIPGLGVDPTTSGANAHLGLAYYFYPNSDCTPETCELAVGFISSPDGGATWSTSRQLAGPFDIRALPQTRRTGGGFMVGDYISTSFVGGTAHPVFAIATGETCVLGEVGSCDVFMASPSSGLASEVALRATQFDTVLEPAPRDDQWRPQRISLR